MTERDDGYANSADLESWNVAIRSFIRLFRLFIYLIWVKFVKRWTIQGQRSSIS